MDWGPYREQLVREIVAGFATPETLRTWLGERIKDENPYNIMTGAKFDAQALNLLMWAEATGRQIEILQALAEFPPTNDPRLSVLITGWTRGVVTPAAAKRSGIPPIEPVNDWFVTRRPFVNRCELRRELEKLATAPPGPDSILLIGGPDYSGKSLSIQFAVRCAPQDKYEVIDLDQFGSRQITADQLAASIFRKSRPAGIDLTKEDRAVPDLLNWLKGQLHGTGYWILIDHCNRPALTAPAQALLRQLAEDIERGYLAGVRLVLADADPAQLPPRLATANRRDQAQLPDRAAVDDWCRTLAKHMRRAFANTDILAYVEEVFADFPAVIAGPDLTTELEERLLAAFRRIEALGETDGIDDLKIA